MSKEAKAHVKINKLLEQSGWRFFDNEDGPANILLENSVKITKANLDETGEDFEKVAKGYVDFTLLDGNSRPIAVLEAKKEGKEPLDAKEQARKYALAQKARFIILSNGHKHYFWDIEKGNPVIITKFPTLESLFHSNSFKPDTNGLVKAKVQADYIAVSKMPDYASDPRWQDRTQQADFLKDNDLKMLRPYQLKAIEKLQESVKSGNNRFLFEMATGTGKTLLAAAIIKLFIKTGNAKRVLFLVDRLELEEQAHKRFVQWLKNDYTAIIYKEDRDGWRSAEIVVTTVQSLLFDNKYQRLFAPNDFDFIISDEAHRSINGNSRAVFEYFTGYKLGLTATPKDYLKNIKNPSEKDPREMERRQLMDTYETFGCKSGNPTFRYSLLDGVKEGYLVNPKVVDARTKITTQLLSDRGYSMLVGTEDEKEEKTFWQRDFERKFFSEPTNHSFCRAFMDNALKDPISGEIGKSIIFCVSQSHASKITQTLNEIAHIKFGDFYNSDFAVQVTSNVQDSQQMTINFANNNLNGNSRIKDGYKTSKTRVCVTVAMMTTGYDCEDLLNIGMLRPVFSPSEFVQMKGRGTRKFTFRHKDFDEEEQRIEKKNFKLFDFFGNCEYFEEKFNYDEELKITLEGGEAEPAGDKISKPIDVTSLIPDPINNVNEQEIGPQGMKIDRELYKNFETSILNNEYIKNQYAAGNMAEIERYVKEEIFNKPEAYFNLEKLKKALRLDRGISVTELIAKIFGRIKEFKTKEELLEEEVDKFISIYQPKSENISTIRNFLMAYICDAGLREIVEKKSFADLNGRSDFTMKEYKLLGDNAKKVIEYVKQYVNLNIYGGGQSA